MIARLMIGAGTVLSSCLGRFLHGKQRLLMRLRWGCVCMLDFMSTRWTLEGRKGGLGGLPYTQAAPCAGGCQSARRFWRVFRARNTKIQILALKTWPLLPQAFATSLVPQTHQSRYHQPKPDPPKIKPTYQQARPQSPPQSAVSHL